MSKLAHSNEDTMFDIEFRHVVQTQGHQEALFLSKEIRKERWDRLVEKSDKRMAEAKVEALRRYNNWLLTDRLVHFALGVFFGIVLSSFLRITP